MSRSPSRGRTVTGRSGRVFLVGDAAHVMPPYGGLGGNTGVQDAHALAWMIAAVLRGDAPEQLLDRYEAERRPIDRLTVEQALLRSRKAPGQSRAEGAVETLWLSLGIRYGAEGAEDAAGFDDPAVPTMEIGTCAPHVALRDGRSVLDLLDPRRFTLIAGSADIPATEDARVTVVPVSTADIEPQVAQRWEGTYGRDPGFLVRPDGVLAGRVTGAEDVSGLVDRALTFDPQQDRSAGA